MSSLADRVDPMLALGVAVLAVSTSAILIRAGDAPEPAMAFYRVLFTTLILLPFVPRYRSEFSALAGRDLLFAGIAGLALAAHFAAWFESVDRTTIAASVTLVQTAPVFVAIGAWTLLDERLTRRMIGGIVLAASGSAVMSIEGFLGTGGPEPLLGNALALVGAVMAAAYVLGGRAVRQRVSLVPYVVVVYAVCTVVLAAYVAGSGVAFTGYAPREWMLFLAMAIGPGLFGHTVVNWALEHIESSVVSVTLVGEPVVSTLLALLIFVEVPTVATLLGGAIVLAGIVVTARARGGG